MTNLASGDFYIWGPHAVQEALDSKLVRVHEIWLAKRYDHLKFKGKAHSVENHYLDRMLTMTKHQGVAARVSLETHSSVKDWLNREPAGAEKARRILALDQIEDPQNLGAIYRSAHFFKFDAVLSPRDHSAPINGYVAKASAGALFSIPTIRCANLARELDAMVDLSFWRIGLDADAEKSLSDFSHRGSIVVVLGNEGQGMRRLTRDSCDELLSIFNNSGRDSLNVSAAAAIALYQLTTKN